MRWICSCPLAMTFSIIQYDLTYDDKKAEGLAVWIMKGSL